MGISQETQQRQFASLAADLEQLPLEPIYTGKAFSAMLAALLDEPGVRDSPTLFWNTCPGRA